MGDDRSLTEKTLLLVEDQESLRLLLDEIFECEELSVVMAATGAEALGLLPCCRPDLMLLDWHLPQVAGSAVLKEARRMYPRLPVIIMTGDSSGYERGEICSSLPGVVEVLAKPFDLFRARDLVMKHLSTVVNTVQ